MASTQLHESKEKPAVEPFQRHGGPQLPNPEPTWGIIVRKRLFPTTKRIWKHFWCLTARQGQLCLTLWTLTVLSGTKANECCSVAAVQLLEVTDGQFGFLQLDFDQVALIAPQLQEDNSTTMQRKWKHCESLNENQGWEPGAREPNTTCLDTGHRGRIWSERPDYLQIHFLFLLFLRFPWRAV